MTETPSKDDVAMLAKQAGLDLPEDYLLELTEAYGHVRAMVGRIPSHRARSDEPAHVFVPARFRTEG